jgi:hypothetical protein
VPVLEFDVAGTGGDHQQLNASVRAGTYSATDVSASMLDLLPKRFGMQDLPMPRHGDDANIDLPTVRCRHLPAGPHVFQARQALVGMRREARIEG